MKKFKVFGSNWILTIDADNIVVLHNGDFRFYRGKRLVAHFGNMFGWIEDDVEHINIASCGK